MKFDLKQEIKNLNGIAFKVGEDKEPLTLLAAIHFALRAPVVHQEGQMVGLPRALTTADLDDREKILEGIKGDTLDIKPELITSLRRLIGASGLIPEACLQVSVLLNSGGRDN